MRSQTLISRRFLFFARFVRAVPMCRTRESTEFEPNLRFVGMQTRNTDPALALVLTFLANIGVLEFWRAWIGRRHRCGRLFTRNIFILDTKSDRGAYRRRLLERSAAIVSG
jgi:hypothetical protein